MVVFGTRDGRLRGPAVVEVCGTIISAPLTFKQSLKGPIK